MSKNATPFPASGFFGKNPSLKIKEFVSYLTLRFGIIFALNMQTTIIYFWIFELTRDKLSLGLVGLAEVIPAIGCSFFSGHVVDQNEKRKMVFTCLVGYVITGICLFVIALPAVHEQLSIVSISWFIYLFIFIGGALRAFYSPSMFALFGMVVPREHYPNATSWSSMAWQMGAVLGPLAAGFFIAWFGIAIGLLTVVVLEIILFYPLLRIAVKPILKKSEGTGFAKRHRGIALCHQNADLACGPMPRHVFGVVWRRGGLASGVPERDFACQ